ncbi:MAG: UDP-N-acetylglucosamine 1-carboxyvinyltransferase [Candidatus Paceibacterota bacterium]|jgi:UDP-N-acetylglucosamine 1-carboxyvinyltransferase|nr:UDP-N-acetylglucosamine 1-carboxyvinyltransferase [Candidatus Paceibacterota bacterium]
MADHFVIQGDRPLRGVIEARGAKNAAFPILAASLLTKKECTIGNLPLIEDVFRIIELLKSMGAKVTWEGERRIKIKNSQIDPDQIRGDLIGLLRGSVLLFGPLLARFGNVKFPQPGGCIIGARPIDAHLDGFKQLGVKITKDGNKYLLSGRGSGGAVVLNEFSVTATENLMLFASLIPKKTIIKTADQDYQVQELAKFLKKMGVKIKGIGTHRLIIEGKRQLNGATHKIMNDPIEAGTFILTAAACKGDVLVKNVEVDFLELPLKKLKDFGVPCEISGKTVRVRPWKQLKIDKIQSLPYPGIPSDLQSAFGVLATQAKGSTLIHDPLYEGRLKYLEELNKMGAEIYFADPHRAIINGPTQLYGRELGSFDLRGGAALIIAGLIAKGESIINNIYQIDRGYEKIEERLQKIGAAIKRVKN